ncbi:hypothetical protein Glove_70g60 [Diversispora epigaea]|uniref:AAA+ ATPase domain-containing protein n=1 Tax=Diversispora epigaea TaxID=1348612 RepID=A0A397JDI1_9GLOM|nr:hypothetical protein Glove_70g60 [Diversispora epigaea]
MSLSKITLNFRRSIFPSRHTLFLRRQNLVSRNSEPVPFQLSLYRPYTNSAPNDFEKWKSAWNKKWTPIRTYLRSIALIKLAWDTAVFLWSGGVILFAGDLLYIWWVSHSNERLINETMEKGTRPKLTVLNNEHVPRPEIIKLLERIFQPSKNHSYYHVVCGEHGTGKTTLTREVANKVGQGVIYVDIPPNFNKLGDEFGKALNFSFEEDFSITLKLKKKVFGETKSETVQSYSKWERAMDAFMRASEVYKAKHGKPPIIIYDNVSRLVHKNSEILDILQDYAKDDAIENNYVAVFVSSEGSVPRRMELRSAWSRADKPVIEIGDLSKEETMEYLIKKRGINSVEAERLYDLVGGRLVDLKYVADKSLAGQSFEFIKQSIFTEVKKKFDSANLLQNQSNHEAGKRLIRILLDSKEINTDLFREYFKGEKYSEVLEANVFAYHPSRDRVTFQSQSTECYIRENANIFIKQKSWFHK